MTILYAAIGFVNGLAAVFNLTSHDVWQQRLGVANGIFGIVYLTVGLALATRHQWTS